MFKRALFPTDLSDYSDALLDCLPALKTSGLEHVVLLNVIRASEVPMADSPVNSDSITRVQWGRAECLYLARKALEGQGLAVRTRVEYGNPAREILRVAQEEYVDLIVMGTQGEGVLQELLLGGTVFSVLRASPVPVLIQKFKEVRALGHGECRHRCAHTFSRVLFLTDLSESDRLVFATVKHLKAAGAESVVLLHVADAHTGGDVTERQNENSRPTDIERLEQMKRDLMLYGLRSEGMLRQGLPWQEVLKTADEFDCSVIVLRLRPRSAWQELVTASGVEKIVRESARPVLVVPEIESKLV